MEVIIMKKRLLGLAMALVLLLGTGTTAYADVTSSGGTGNTNVALTAAAATFSVTVPTSLPVNVDANGVVTTANGLKIVNNSYGSVLVTGVSVAGANAWTTVDYTTDMLKEKVGAKKIALSINGCNTGATGALAFNQANFPALDGANAGATDELALTYSAKLPAQKTAISNLNAAIVTFTIAWNE